MGDRSLMDMIRNFIGSIAWPIFLWSIQMTNEEYMDAVNPEFHEEACPKCKQYLEVTDPSLYCPHCGGY